MTGHLKILAAALGLVLAAGSIADVSAKTMTTKTASHRTHAVKTLHFAKPAYNGPRVRIARHHAVHRLAKVPVGPRTSKQVGAVHRERHATNHHAVAKASSVIR